MFKPYVYQNNLLLALNTVISGLQTFLLMLKRVDLFMRNKLRYYLIRKDLRIKRYKEVYLDE